MSWFKPFKMEFAPFAEFGNPQVDEILQAHYLPNTQHSILSLVTQRQQQNDVLGLTLKLPAGYQVNSEADFEQFHEVLASKCGNERLIQFLQQLERETLRAEFLDYARRWHWDRLVDNHQRMIDALEEKRFDDLLVILERDRLAALELPAEALHGEPPPNV